MDPTPSDVHVNVPLTNISVAYIQNAQNFIASRMYPVIPVDKQTNRYITYDRGYWNRDNMAVRAPATRAERTGWKLDNTPSYSCILWALAHDVPDEVVANTDAPVDNPRAATILLTQASLIRREKLWTAAHFNTGKWTTEYGGVALSGSVDATHVLQWNDPGSTPIEDVRRAKRAMLQLTGFEPNVLALGRAVYDALVDHPDIIDRLKYGQTAGSPAMASRESLARLFEVERIEVSAAIENTAVEGQANVHAFIGGKHALLAYVPKQPGLMIPSAGYTFAWRGLMGMDEQGTRMLSYRLGPDVRAESHEIEMAIDQKQVAADLGAFFYTVVA